MATVEELIKTFNKRKIVVCRKIDTPYRKDYNEGLLFAYTEILSELNTLEK